MTLALKMGRTLEELGCSMSSQEFSLWLALYEQDLWGELRDYERAGLIASTVGNFAGKMRAEHSAPLTALDFMPRMGKAEQPETEPDPLAFFTALAKDR